MTDKVPSKLLPVMSQAAHAGGQALMRYYRKPLQVREKKDAGLVTQADLASEKAVIRVLKKAQPQFGILTEEEGSHLSNSPGRWIIDPLDGTTNYVHRFPMFCVSIAAEWKGKIVAGVIYHPVLKDLYAAALGKGATLNGKKIRVSANSQLTGSLLTTGFSYHRDQSLDAEMAAFEKLSRAVRAVRRPGSAALDLAYTACGVFDGFWERKLSPWDVAAGGLIVQEAGGKVTDFQGNPFQITHSAILATNGHLHQELISAVSKSSTSPHSV